MNDEAKSIPDADTFFDLSRELHALLRRARDAAELRGPHGRRLALVATKIEDAWLQAKQGQEEAERNRTA